MRRSGFQLLSKQKRQVIVVLLLAFLFFPFLVDTVDAAPNRPILEETDWRTGELQICWTGVTDVQLGYVMRLFVATHESNGEFILHESFPISTAEGCYISKYFENGQTLWYYVDVHDVLNDEISQKSNTNKQTPPITAFIINWPDMFQDLMDAIQASNNDMKDFLEGLVTPSDQAMNDLQNALDGLKNAVGAGQAGQAGNQLQDGFDSVQSGMRPPIGVDDGNGTFTGGSTGSDLPSGNQNIGNDSGLNLTAPDPDTGTANELTIRIPYMVDMNGDLVYMQLFTEEQMEKMKWLNLIRTLAGAIIFIMFGIWLVSRFSPQLKS